MNLKTIYEDPLIEVDLDTNDIWIDDRLVWHGKTKELELA